MRGRTVEAVCRNSACGRTFLRRPCDLARSKRGPFCSVACNGTFLRTGRTLQQVECHGCGASFGKLKSEVKRSDRHYCRHACYLANVDRQALGRAGAAVPREVPYLARFLRAQKAGLSRARNLSPERLHEIAMMGVAARVAKKAARGPYRKLEGRKIARARSFIGPLLQCESSDG